MSNYRDTIGKFKLFIVEKLSKVNKNLTGYGEVKRALAFERRNREIQTVTNQLRNVLRGLDLTIDEYYKLLNLKHLSNIEFHKGFIT